MKLGENGDMISWEWNFLEVSSIRGGGRREYVRGSEFLLWFTRGKSQTLVIICKVIIGLKLFIRFCLLLKGSPFCSGQIIFDIIVKRSYYDLLGDCKKYLIKKGKKMLNLYDSKNKLLWSTE